MVSIQKGLQGRNVYSQGSYAPTRGPVSAQGAQGYLKREIRQGNVGTFGGVSTVGNDGKSDTRSGGAKRLIDNRKAPITGPWAGGIKPGGIKPGGMQTQPGGSTSGTSTPPTQGGIRQAPLLPGQAPNHQDPNAPGSNGPGMGVPLVTPPVTSPQAVTVGNAGQIELPYNQEWASSLVDNLGGYNADLAQMQIEQQQFNQQFNQDVRDNDINRVETQKNTNNLAAGQGTLFSTAFSGTYARNESDFATSLERLKTDNTTGNASFGLRRNGIIDSFKRQMEQDALDYADSTAQDAGDLGYGNDDQELTDPQDSSAYGPTGPGRQPPKPHPVKTPVRNGPKKPPVKSSVKNPPKITPPKGSPWASPPKNPPKKSPASVKGSTAKANLYLKARKK